MSPGCIVPCNDEEEAKVAISSKEGGKLMHVMPEARVSGPRQA